MNSQRAAFLQDIEAFAHDSCAHHDPAHDIMHVRRVVTNAEAILTQEPDADRFITLAAAWLHDIVQLPKGSGPPGEAARRSADEARRMLSGLDIDAATVDAVDHAITAHSFSGGMRPESLEAAIVQDADRLDALGAIGIARLWVTAGELNSKLHHLEDPAGLHRELDDRSFGLDHITVKLLKLPDLMNTAAGKSMAASRAEFLVDYRQRFIDELGGTA